MSDILIPLKCPVCGGPVDRGLTRCKYCETSFFQPVSKIEEKSEFANQPSDSSLLMVPLDCNVIYSNNEPYVLEYRGKTFPDLKTIEMIETSLRNGNMTPNEARQKLGLSIEEAIEAINNFERRFL